MPQRVLSKDEFEAIKAKVLASAPDDIKDEADFHRWAAPRMEQALGEAENTPAPVEGSALERFASNAGEIVNPIAIAKGIGSAVLHPIDTISNIGAASADQGRQAWEAAKEGRLTEAAGHTLAMAPVIGPAAAAAGEQIAQGDIAGGLGKGAGLVGTMLIPTAVKAGAKAVRALPESIAVSADAGAASRVADVMAPKVGANKVRFGGMAEDVAPALARDMVSDGAPMSRTGFHAQVGAKLSEAEQALDAASDARLGARTFPTQQLIDGLLAKRRALTSEAVDASHSVAEMQGPSNLQAPARHPFLETPIGSTSIGGKVNTPTQPPTPSGVSLGNDVVPGPNAPRVAVIDQAIDELKKLGKYTRYDAVRGIRQAYDGQAKVAYSPSMTADFLKAKGGALGASDVTGVLRDTLAKWDPETAKANAQYSLYRAADDVLQATAEVERTRPKVGRQLVARWAGAAMGGQAAGIGGAIAGYAIAPMVESAASAGATTKLMTAKLFTRFATAIRSGNVSYANSLASQLRRLGATAAGVVGSSTSPSGSQTQSTAAIPSTP